MTECHWSDSLCDVLTWDPVSGNYFGMDGQRYGQLPEDHEPLEEEDDQAYLLQEAVQTFIDHYDLPLHVRSRPIISIETNGLV